MAILNICLQDFSKRCPMGATLEQGNKVIASDYCDTKEDFVEFAKENADKIDSIAIVVDFEDIDDTAVLDFGAEVVREIKKELSANG